MGKFKWVDLEEWKALKEWHKQQEINLAIQKAKEGQPGLLMLLKLKYGYRTTL